jgi:hypothetical protein
MVTLRNIYVLTFGEAFECGILVENGFSYWRWVGEGFDGKVNLYIRIYGHITTSARP